MKNLFLILLFISINLRVFPQWEFGGSYNYRSEEPGSGLGITVSRNLPFQWPVAGFKVRLGMEIYRSTEHINDVAHKYIAEDLHLDLIGSFFIPDFIPYAGLSAGLGHQDIHDFDEYIFFAGMIAGLRFAFSSWIQPYLEIRLHKYFSSFEITTISGEISSVQIIGAGGIIIRFNTIK